MIDVLHRILWLMENSPRKMAEFFVEAQPDRERLRVLAQTLAGAALSGKSAEDAEKLVSTTAAEQAALGKLLANWRSSIEHAGVTKEEKATARPVNSGSDSTNIGAIMIRDLELKSDGNGKIYLLRAAFGPHHFLELIDENGKVSLTIGATHHRLPRRCFGSEQRVGKAL